MHTVNGFILPGHGDKFITKHVQICMFTYRSKNNCWEFNNSVVINLSGWREIIRWLMSSLSFLLMISIIDCGSILNNCVTVNVDTSESLYIIVALHKPHASEFIS